MMNNMAMARNKPAVVVNLKVAGNADSYPNRSFVLRPPAFAMSIGRSSSTRDGKYLPASDNGWFESRVVSRGHAVIKASPDMKAVFVEDIGSMHGTFVNERKVGPREKTMLVTGDTIRFGTDVSRGPETFPPLRATVEYRWINERAADLPEEIQRAFNAYDDEESDIEFLEESPYKPSTIDTIRQSRTFSVPDSDVSVAGSISDGDDVQEISADEAMSSAQGVTHRTDETQEAENHTPSSSEKGKEPISPQTPDAQIEPTVDIVPETIADNLENILAPSVSTPALRKITHTGAPQTFVNLDYEPLEDENMTESDYGSHDSDEYPYDEEYPESADGDSEEGLPAVTLKVAEDIRPADAAPVIADSYPDASHDTTDENNHPFQASQSLKSPQPMSNQPRAPSPSDAAMPKPIQSESRPQSRPVPASNSTTSFPMFPYGFTSYGNADLGVNPSHISYEPYRLPAPPEPHWLSNQVYRSQMFPGSVPTYPSNSSNFSTLDVQPSGSLLSENNADRQPFIHFLESGPSESAKAATNTPEAMPQAEKSCKKVSISEIIAEHKLPEVTASAPKHRGTKRKMDVVEREEEPSSPTPEEASSDKRNSPAPDPAAITGTTYASGSVGIADSGLEGPSIIITEAIEVEERPAKRVKTDSGSSSGGKVASLVKYAAVATVSAFAGAAGLFSVLVALPEDYFVGGK